MVDDILTEVGVQFRRSRFPKPPSETYIVFTDDEETNGADVAPNMVINHNVTVEVYEASPDDGTEAAVETALNKRGLAWDKQDRYWLQSEQRYQVAYDFSYYEKRRMNNG